MSYLLDQGKRIKGKEGVIERNFEALAFEAQLGRVTLEDVKPSGSFSSSVWGKGPGIRATRVPM